MTTTGSSDEQPLRGLTAEEALELAEKHGLTRVGVRPPLRSYIKESWRKRRFLWTLASSQAVSRNQNNYLGQLWAVLNPLALAVAYWLVFGLLLDTREGTDNYVAFLTSGIFTFTMISGILTNGSRSILRNLGLVRALRFPRCFLPLSAVISEMLVALPAFAVLFIILFATGEPFSWNWLLLPVALLNIFFMTSGLTMIAARLLETSRDLGNLVPIAIRLLRYISGVFFSIEAYAGTGLIGNIMYYQPIAASLSLVRQSLLAEFPPTAMLWLVSSAWSVLLFSIGFVVFWRAEARYGRG